MGKPEINRHGSASTSFSNNSTIAILAYCASSIFMTLINKFVVSGSGFNLNFFLLFVQCLTSSVVILGLKATGVIKNLAAFDLRKAREWFPISFLLVVTIYTGSKALQYLSVPVYMIFKNLTIVLIAYGEYLWFNGSRVTGMTLFSFSLMIGSSIIASWADIQHALDGSGQQSHAAVESVATLNAGYMWMLFNCLSNATFVLVMRKRIKSIGFKDFDTMFYNNTLSIPVLLFFTFVTEDWSAANIAINFPPSTRTQLASAFVISGVTSIFISYTSAWCVRVTSSTTYSMVGALNKLPTAISGLIFFDAPITFGSVSAIILSILSGFVYSYAKVMQSKPADEKLPR